MKKLLVLSLVLGIASLATAGITGMTGGTGSFTADGVENAGIHLIVLEGYAGTVSLPAGGNLDAILNDYGLMSVDDMGVPGLSGFNAYVWEIGVGDSGALLPHGPFVAFTETAGTTIFGAEGDTVAWVVDNNQWAVVQSIAAVPEPATMALLGLGALVLRRKK